MFDWIPWPIYLPFDLYRYQQGVRMLGQDPCYEVFFFFVGLAIGLLLTVLYAQMLSLFMIFLSFVAVKALRERILKVAMHPVGYYFLQGIGFATFWLPLLYLVWEFRSRI